jgi:hypothetical protein
VLFVEMEFRESYFLILQISISWIGMVTGMSHCAWLGIPLKELEVCVCIGSAGDTKVEKTENVLMELRTTRSEKNMTVTVSAATTFKETTSRHSLRKFLNL